MICQTSVLNYARFFALHFARVRFAFSHRDRIETHLQNLNIPSRVLLCLRLALPARCREALRARVFTFPAPRRSDPGWETGRSSSAPLPPSLLPLPIGRQVGPHLRDRPTHPFSSLRSPPRALRGWRYLCEPSLSPKPEPDRYAQVTWTACALSPPLAARGAAGLLGDSFSLNAHVALDCVCGPTGPHWV